MIRIRIKGRLGNQMFIYAFARALQYRYNQPVLIYDRKDEANTTWYSHLNGFRLHPAIEFTSDKAEVMKMTLQGKLLFFLDRLFMRMQSNREVHERQLKYWHRNLQNGLLLLMDGYHDLPDTIPDELFCDGYFQSPCFFNDIRETLLQEFYPVDTPSVDEQKFLQQIESCESVCVTIRLGDYLGNKVHQVCTKDYYIRAMHKLKELYPTCQFFIFSDEIKKAEQIFQFPYPVIYDAGTSRDTMSLFIMSNCRHFILSNSSFSWWAQWLSQNPNKTVISPTRWYAEDIPCDIMQPEWLQLEC